MRMEIYNHFLPLAETKSLNLFLSLMSFAHYYTQVSLTPSIQKFAVRLAAPTAGSEPIALCHYEPKAGMSPATTVADIQIQISKCKRQNDRAKSKNE